MGAFFGFRVSGALGGSSGGSFKGSCRAFWGFRGLWSG